MTTKMNNNPTNPNTATREQGLSGDSVDVDLSLGTLPAAAAAHAAAAREEMQGEVENAVESETVLLQGNGIVNFQGMGVLSKQTIAELLKPIQGGDSVPVILTYGKDGSITIQDGELAVEESGTDAGKYVAGPSGPMNYNGDLSNGDNDRAADAGNPVEFTPTIRFVAA